VKVGTYGSSLGLFVNNVVPLWYQEGDADAPQLYGEVNPFPDCDHAGINHCTPLFGGGTYKVIVT